MKRFLIQTLFQTIKLISWTVLSLLNLPLIAQPRQTAKPSAAIILEQPTNDPRVKNRSFELVSSIGATADGKQIYVAWYTGNKDEGPGNYVTLAVSNDNGKTWLNDQLVAYPREPTSRMYDPSLWRDKFGKIWFFYTSVGHNKFWDLKGGVNAIPIWWDGSKVAHGPSKLVSNGLMMNKPTDVIGQNFAFFPVSVWRLSLSDTIRKDPNYVQDGTFIKKYSYSKLSDTVDTLAEYSSIRVFPDSIRIFDEHQVVQTSERGDFLCMVRTKKGIYHATSSDYGKNWSTVVPFTLTGPTTSSRFHISRLKSGNLLLILNNSRQRTNMTAYVSKDGGKSWPYSLLLDNRDKVSYPDASQTDDGTIHVTHDRDRYGVRDILYLRFREDDILKGNTQNIFRTRVNPL